jgi:uncharacterized protein (UPF0276 family)
VSDLPELGVGLMYFPGLEPVLESALRTEPGLLDVVEVEAQPSSRLSNGALRLRPELGAYLGSLAQANLVHSIGAPVAGTVRAPELLTPVVDAVETLAPPWASEHLNFDHVPAGDGGYFANFLLPAVQSGQVVDMTADNVRSLRSRLGVPIAIETPVNYLRPYPGELRDGLFYGAVANQADCGLLVDLHNLWCNERNGRQPVLDVIGDLPADRIWEIHLAGGRQLDDYWVDAHAGLVEESLWELAAEVVMRLPNLKAIIFEVMPEYLAADGTDPGCVVGQLERMHELWVRRGTAAPLARVQAPERASGASGLPDATAWERALGSCTRGMPGADELSHFLSADPGVGIYRRMIASVRIGTLVDVMPLTYRMLTLSLGDAGTDRLLKHYLADSHGHWAAHHEVEQFQRWLVAHAPEVSNLHEVAEFEIAAIQADASGRAQAVRFTREPLELLRALGSGGLPPPAGNSGDYVLEVQP